MSKSDRRPRRDVGFRFLPTDEELVVNYLLSKLIGVPLPSSGDYVNDCDLYGDLEPWEIWHKFRGRGCEEEEQDEDSADNDLYFVTPLKKRTATGMRIDRSVGSNGGSWHGEDSGKEAQTPDGLVSWTVKRFSYRPKKSKGGQEKNGLGPGPTTSTSWIMHEYCLLDRPIPFLGLDSAAATRLAVCRIRKKPDSSSKKRKNNKGPKVIFIDPEGDDYNDVVEAESSTTIDNKRQKVDTTSFQTETESCSSEVKEGCGGGNPDEGAVASYVAELERSLSGVEEDCGGGNLSGGEEAISSYVAELEGLLSEVREDCGGDNGGDEGEVEEALLDAEIEDCLAEVEEEEDDGSWLEAEIEGSTSEEEVAASTTSDFEALIQRYFSAGAAPGVVTSSAVTVPSY